MNKVILIILISASVFSSCVRTEKIDDFPVEKPKIVVNSFLKNNEPIEFFLSKSLSSIDNAKIKKISNAEIKIYENDILIETIIKESTNPTGSNLDAYYMSNVKPQIGKHYKFSASVYNLATVTAEADLPKELKGVTGRINKLDTTIYIFPKMFGNEDSAKYNINIRECSILLNIPDMANEKNYYKIILKAEEKYWNGIKWDYRYRNVYLNNEESNYENYDNGLFLTDKLYDGKNIPVKLDISYGYIQSAEPKVKFKIIVSSQSDEKQKYDVSLGQFYQNRANPFVEPTLVYTNILGGYGIFASESTFEIILE